MILDTEAVATFYPGNCDGTFDTANTRIFGAGFMAGAAALADVNGDGKLDLVSSASPVITTGLHTKNLGNAVGVQFGDGTGNFSAPTIFRGEYVMFSFAVADLNGDGHPDIVTANQDTDSVSVCLNDGHGGFGGPAGGYLGYLTAGQMHVVFDPVTSNFLYADVNKDGNKDLVLLETPPPVSPPHPTNRLAGRRYGQVLVTDSFSTPRSRE